MLVCLCLCVCVFRNYAFYDGCTKNYVYICPFFQILWALGRTSIYSPLILRIENVEYAVYELVGLDLGTLPGRADTITELLSWLRTQSMAAPNGLKLATMKSMALQMKHPKCTYSRKTQNVTLGYR